MKAIDIFRKLFRKAYQLSGSCSGRINWSDKRNPGPPGELVKSLSNEEREILKDLRSSDLSEEKIPHGEIDIISYYANITDPDMPNYIKDQKLKFDKKIVK